MSLHWLNIVDTLSVHQSSERNGEEGKVDAAEWRQPADREGQRRRPRAGLHRGHAELETRGRAPPRRLITRTVPGVNKAVKWNSPFYGTADQGWFASFHCFTRYVKVTFFCGASLRPVPPGESQQKDVRYLDIHEDDPIDEARLAAWVKQASRLPGWGGG
jgi:hypothetical protein